MRWMSLTCTASLIFISAVAQATTDCWVQTSGSCSGGIPDECDDLCLGSSLCNHTRYGAEKEVPLCEKVSCPNAGAKRGTVSIPVDCIADQTCKFSFSACETPGLPSKCRLWDEWNFGDPGNGCQPFGISCELCD